MITIFTPTFNRAKTLPALYESLVLQTDKDFEWLIVDDGSTDITKNLVEEWISERKLPIQYFFQENSGKHIAINKGVKAAKGDYFVNIDSDDFLTTNCIEICKKIIIKVEEGGFAGFTFAHHSTEIQLAEDAEPIEFTDRKKLIWKFPGEMMYCLKTEIYRKYPFPEFQGEKFCPESLILGRIEKAEQILYTTHILVRGKYLEDGLSAQFFSLLKNSPNAALLNYQEKFFNSESEAERKMLAKLYFDIALSSNVALHKKIFTLPVSFLIIYLKNKLFNETVS